MAGLLDYGLCPTDTTAAIQEFNRVEKGLTSVTLVPSCTGAPAMGAGAFDKAVCKEALACRTVQLFILVLVDISSRVYLGKDLLHDTGLLRGASCRNGQT